MVGEQAVDLARQLGISVRPANRLIHHYLDRRAVHDYLNKATRATDVSRLDRALREIAGKAPGTPKTIEAAPGVLVDVTALYDADIDSLAARIAQEVLTRYPEAVSRILLAGGGAYRLQRALRAYSPAGKPMGMTSCT
jgi:hypothetical protein